MVVIEPPMAGMAISDAARIMDVETIRRISFSPIVGKNISNRFFQSGQELW